MSYRVLVLLPAMLDANNLLRGSHKAVSNAKPAGVLCGLHLILCLLSAMLMQLCVHLQLAVFYGLFVPGRKGAYARSNEVCLSSVLRHRNSYSHAMLRCISALQHFPELFLMQ